MAEVVDPKRMPVGESSSYGSSKNTPSKSSIDGAQLAASAIQGINTNASIGYSAGDSYSQNESLQWENSRITHIQATD